MKTQLINSGLLIIAFSLAAAGALYADKHNASTIERARDNAENSGSATHIRDSSAHAIPIQDYQRIVSVNTVADRLLLELVEPERLVAITRYSQESHPDGWRFGERHSIAKADDLEAILALKPDLVIASAFADPSFNARLREGGVQVVDIGEVRGVRTTLQGLRILSSVLNVRQRGVQLEQRFLQRLAALEGQRPPQGRVSGIYLTYYGDAFFGGTTGSSYSDVMYYGGFDDVAAKHGYRDWPKYTPAELLTMNPVVIVTQTDMGEAICEHSALRALAACQPGGRVIEMTNAYHSDPGLGIAEAALALQKLLYGS